MRATRCVGMIFVLSLGLSGCGGKTPEGVMEKGIATMDAMADALEKGDKEGVKAAAKTMGDLDAQAKAFKLTPEQEGALKDKYSEKMKPVVTRLLKAMGGAVAGGKFTPAELDEIGKSMKSK